MKTVVIYPETGDVYTTTEPVSIPGDDARRYGAEDTKELVEFAKATVDRLELKEARRAKVKAVAEFIRKTINEDFDQRAEKVVAMLLDDDRPLQVGDTVLVPKGATFAPPSGYRGECNPKVQGKIAQITELADTGWGGNLVVAVPNIGSGFFVHPDQVTRVEQ